MKIKVEFLVYIAAIAMMISFVTAFAYYDKRESALPNTYSEFSIEKN